MSADMNKFNEVFSHLKADPYAVAALEDMIGREFVYDIPEEPAARDKFIRANGTLILKNKFKIIGIQRDYKGDLAYRAVCLGFDDTFGRCVSPKEIQILE